MYIMADTRVPSRGLSKIPYMGIGLWTDPISKSEFVRSVSGLRTESPWTTSGLREFVAADDEPGLSRKWCTGWESSKSWLWYCSSLFCPLRHLSACRLQTSRLENRASQRKHWYGLCESCWCSELYVSTLLLFPSPEFVLERLCRSRFSFMTHIWVSELEPRQIRLGLYTLTLRVKTLGHWVQQKGRLALMMLAGFMHTRFVTSGLS
jgi:hypothetical protein